MATWIESVWDQQDPARAHSCRNHRRTCITVPAWHQDDVVDKWTILVLLAEGLFNKGCPLYLVQWVHQSILSPRSLCCLDWMPWFSNGESLLRMIPLQHAKHWHIPCCYLVPWPRPVWNPPRALRNRVLGQANTWSGQRNDRFRR
jgi:hypothetical protein